MRRALLLTLLLAACGPPEAPPEDVSAAASTQTAAEPAVVFLVRHAEKVDTTDASPLTAAGQARAQALARLLADAGITRVLSTDFVRTRRTAQPLADALGVDVEHYDPSDLGGLAARLAAAGERVLIVGHSNTTPALVDALGGTPGPPIAESEYDRLYAVTLPPHAAPTTVLLRY